MPYARQGSGLRPSQLTVRPEIELGRIDDAAERQADQMAERALGYGTVERSGSERAHRAQLQPLQAPPRVATALAGGGRPLDAHTRAFFEPRFGVELSAIRIHDGERAAESAAAVGARAYAVGRDIVLGGDVPPLATPGGRMLLAHELAHTIQSRHDASGATALRRSPLPGRARRVPEPDLSQPEEYDEFSSLAVRVWLSDPEKPVSALVNTLVAEANALLAKNGVPPVRPIMGSAAEGGPLAVAFFDGRNWSVTIDVPAIAGGSQAPFQPVSGASKLRTLTNRQVAKLGSVCYHEFRHAEQTFSVARLVAEEGKGRTSAKAIATHLGIQELIAQRALDARHVLSSAARAQAESLRATEKGGRHWDYRQFTQGLADTMIAFSSILARLDDESVDVVLPLWRNAIHPFLDKMRHTEVSQLQAMLARKRAIAHPDAFDADVLTRLTDIDQKLFSVLAMERALGDVAGDAWVKGWTRKVMFRGAPPEEAEANLKKLTTQAAVVNLALAVMNLGFAANEAYLHYPHEADADKVRYSVEADIEQAIPNPPPPYAAPVLKL